MGVWSIVGCSMAGLVVVALIVTTMKRRRSNAHTTKVRGALAVEPSGDTFAATMVEGLPAPTKRLFLHAIDEGTPLASRVDIVQRGWMKQAPDKPFLELEATERLTPRVGFYWQAHGRMGPVPFRVRDHYLADDAAMQVTLLGLVTIVDEAGPDIVRSAKGRLAAETLWCPTALLPGPGITWEPVDDRHARVVQEIDGESVAMILEVDDEGRLVTLTMERHGNVGTDSWQAIPYGFTATAEASFGGMTIASRLEGGWWYGTESFKPENASRFEIVDASFS